MTDQIYIEIFECNNISEFVRDFGSDIKIDILPEKPQMAPPAEIIAFYIVFLIILEIPGNFFLYCIIVYEKYCMDPQKRTLTNQLLSMMLLAQIALNVSIMPIYAIHQIFGFQSKHYFSSHLFWLEYIISQRGF